MSFTGGLFYRIDFEAIPGCEEFTLKVDSEDDVFARLNADGAAYVSLRRGADIDVFMKDADLAQLRPLLFENMTRDGACRINAFGIVGHRGGDHLGFSCLPKSLVRRALESRLADPECGYRPATDILVLCLAYRLTYHFNLQSGIDWRDPSNNTMTAMGKALGDAISAARLDLPLDHCSLHNHLVRNGSGVTRARLVAYIRADIEAGRKVFFHAWLINQLPGEMNLFLIRAVAMEKNLEQALVDRLTGVYEVLAVKPVARATRARAAVRMRGGRWDRGGEPCVAVVVFDREPRATSEDQRRVHAFVFNAKQLIKQDWREWFVSATDANPQDNPIHSTDNEAEALAHLPMFFSRRERRDIRRRVDELRGGRARGFGVVDPGRMRVGGQRRAG